MSLQGPRDEAARQDDAIVDNYVRAHWPWVELPDEAPAPAASESGQPSEDEQFDAYMRTFWPGQTPASSSRSDSARDE